jgi:hypothetical protein
MATMCEYRERDAMFIEDCRSKIVAIQYICDPAAVLEVELLREQYNECLRAVSKRKRADASRKRAKRLDNKYGNFKLGMIMNNINNLFRVSECSLCDENIPG